MTSSEVRIMFRASASALLLAIAACSPSAESIAPEGAGTRQPQPGDGTAAEDALACEVSTDLSPDGGADAGAASAPGSVTAALHSDAGVHGPGHGEQCMTPARIVDRSRDPSSTNDYLRISFLEDPNLVPTTVARLNALRAFFTASTFFEPPIPLRDVASYVGRPDEPTNLAAYRCRPPDPDVAVLATWPNVFALLQEDLGAQFSCPPSLTASAENEVFCLVADYVDTPEPSVTLTLAHTFDLAALLFEPADPERAQVLSTLYGIFPAFSGLGYAVRGSESGAPFTAEESLRSSIVPEYLLPNETFAELGCECIIVPPYPGRSEDLLDPEFILERGTPSCRKVERLRPAH